MSPNEKKQKLGWKCDVDTFKTFGDLIYTFCDIKANVEAGMNDHMLADTHIACFKDMTTTRFMVCSWVSEDLIKDFKEVKEGFQALIAAEQVLPSQMPGAAAAGVLHGGGPVFDGGHMYGGQRFKRQDLPRWGGEEKGYFAFRCTFQARTNCPDL